MGPRNTLTGSLADTSFAWAPLASNSFTESKSPFPAAFIRGVNPRDSSFALMSRPASNANRTCRELQAAVAASRKVSPRLSCACTSAPLAISRSTTPSDPLCKAASSRAVRPVLDFAFTSAPCSTSSLTLAGSVTLHIKAVAPSALWAFTSTPAASSSFTDSRLPNAAAYISGVVSRSPREFTPAP